MKKTLKKLGAAAMALCLTCSLFSTAAAAAGLSSITYFADNELDADMVAELGGMTFSWDPTALYFGGLEEDHVLIENPYVLEDGQIFRGWVLGATGSRINIYEPGETAQYSEYHAYITEPYRSAVIYVDAATGEFVGKIEHESILLPSYTVYPELITDGLDPKYGFSGESGLGEGWEAANCPEGYEVTGDYATSEKYTPDFDLAASLDETYDASILHCAIQFVFVNAVEVPETPDTETPDTETPDTETPDTETPDTETPDTETPDTETPDTETPDRTPSNPGNGSSSRPTPPAADVTIDEEETPLAAAPEAVVEETIAQEPAPLAAAPELVETAETAAASVVLVDEAVPMGALPQTGTTDSAAVLAALTLTAGLAAAGLTLTLLRKKEEN